MSEQRKSRRFQLRLPVDLIRLAYPLEAHSGRTQNIGSNGLLLDTSTDLEVGEAVECRIAWPTAAGKPVVLRYFGRVVRQISSDHPGTSLFAIALDRYEFSRPSSAQPAEPAAAAAASA